jgi:dolichol-phosphate mannosyltransferase
MTAPELSVVVPMYNEAQVLPTLVAEVVATLQPLQLPFELVLVDDGSADGTADLAEQLAADEPRIVVLRLSRNFGKESALAAGVDHARGQAVVLMDADLQHPPSVIPQLVERWKQGAQVVNGVKQRRGSESLSYKVASRAFNGVMSRAVGRSFARESDFKLIDRTVVEALSTLPERVRFFRGLVAWVGFRVDEVPFEVADRTLGSTSWSLTGLIRYAVRNIVAFTTVPLRAIAASATGLTVLAGLLAAQTLFNWATGQAVDGFTTVILAVLVVGSANLFALAVLSLYVAAIYEEAKARPIYLIAPPRSPQ